MTSNKIFLEKFGALTDDGWKDVILRSCVDPLVHGVQFPPMPREDLQRHFVGASGADAFNEAFIFYKELKRYACSLGIGLDHNTRVLDFGVGWGRFYRLFLRDFAVENFVGIDVDQECIEDRKSVV